VRARSARQHHATLLNYVGANGVESHRQRTPHNAVAIARMLLDAGAEIDATGDMYGGTTTLGLVATSIHPLQAGVQNRVIAFLIERARSLDRAVAPDYRNGNLIRLLSRQRAARGGRVPRGARPPLTLTGAAGAGRLDAVEPFFDGTGQPKPGISQHELLEALGWASTYGRTPIVEFLLRHGVDPARGCRRSAHGACTPPQWAATPTSSTAAGSKRTARNAGRHLRNTPLAGRSTMSVASERERARFHDTARALVAAAPRSNANGSMGSAADDPAMRAGARPPISRGHQMATKTQHR
jgi:hypothetical protein